MGNGCPVLKSLVALAGRICISLIFVIAGIMKILQYKAMTLALANTMLPKVHWLLILAIIFELGGGILVLIGWFSRFGAFLLIVFVIIATVVFHSFWTFQGTEVVNQTYHFLKNLSILGALLYILAFGAGNYSFDRLRQRG